MKAGHAIVQIFRGFRELPAIRDYSAWLTDWFNHDVRTLKALYRRHPHAPNWVNEENKPNPQGEVLVKNQSAQNDWAF
jgi:hypothetical protein